MASGTSNHSPVNDPSYDETDEVAYVFRNSGSGGLFRSFRNPTSLLSRRPTSGYGSRILLGSSNPTNTPVPLSAGLPETAPVSWFQRNNDGRNMPYAQVNTNIDHGNANQLHMIASTDDFNNLENSRQPNFYRSIHFDSGGRLRNSRNYYCSDLVLNRTRDNGTNFTGLIPRPVLNLVGGSSMHNPLPQDRPIIFTERAIPAPPPLQPAAPILSVSHQPPSSSDRLNAQRPVTLYNPGAQQGNLSAGRVACPPAHRVIINESQTSVPAGPRGYPPLSQVQTVGSPIHIQDGATQSPGHSGENVLLLGWNCYPVNSSDRLIPADDANSPNVAAATTASSVTPSSRPLVTSTGVGTRGLIRTISTPDSGESGLPSRCRVRRVEAVSSVSVGVGTNNNRDAPLTIREIRINRPRQLFTTVAATVHNGGVQNVSSTSGASSIEDIDSIVVPTRVITPSRRSTVRLRRTISDSHSQMSHRSHSNERRCSQDDLTDELGQHKQISQSETDWRVGTTCNLDVWRLLLETGRFVDVFFIVGGPQIFCTDTTPLPSSSDHGAPGGPTGINVTAQPSLTHPLAVSQTETATARASPFTVATICRVPCSSDGAATNDDDNVGTTTGDREDSSPVGHGPSGKCPSDENTSEKLTAVSSNESNNSSPANSLFGSTCSTSAELLVDSVTGVDHSVPGETSGLNSAAHDALVASAIMARPTSRLPSQPIQTVRQDVYSSRFGAHRLVLAAASPVFEAMFYGPAAELSDSDRMRPALEFHIPDIHPKAFYSMLLYIYCEAVELDDDLDVVFYTLYAATKYMLPYLARRCVERLKEMLTALNVCSMLDRCLFFDQDDLILQCWHIVDVLAPDVLQSDGLLRMDTNNLKTLLSRDTLNCTELDVFNAVCRWSAVECHRLGLCDVMPNRAQVASELLRFVRFPTMALADFSKNVANSGFLNLEMVRDVFVHISSSHVKEDHPPAEVTASAAATTCGSSRLPTHRFGQASSVTPSRRSGDQAASKLNPVASCPVQPDISDLVAGCFPTRPRCGPRLLRCRRFTHTGRHLITSNPASTGRQHRIAFQVSAPIFLAGVGVYGSTDAKVCVNVRVQLSYGSEQVPTSTGRQSSSQPSSPERSNRSSVFENEIQRPGRVLEFIRFNWSSRAQSTPRNPLSVSSFGSADPEYSLSSEQVYQQQNALDPNRSSVLTVGRARLDSDGTNRVYDVRFPCPIRLQAKRRYVIQVLSAVVTTPTTPNLISTYIGLFGRSEIKVPCSPQESPGSLNDTRLCSTDSSRRRSLQQRRKHRNQSAAVSAIKQSLKNSAGLVNFQFWDNPTSSEPGEVDKGFLPELLFYPYI